ncbi:MAG: hypothetical protein AB1813_04795 [Verrucomicrobiota bacterium]|jgi:hypothetical protein
MRTLLHILTEPTDPLVESVLEEQTRNPELSVRVIRLTEFNPDYAELVQAVFASDSTCVW